MPKLETKKPLIDRAKIQRVLYRNHKGEIAWRLVQPLETPPEWGSPYHHGEWIFRVWDLDKNAERSYAFSGIIWMSNADVKPPTSLKLTYGDPPELPEKLYV